MGNVGGLGGSLVTLDVWHWRLWWMTAEERDSFIKCSQVRLQGVHWWQHLPQSSSNNAIPLTESPPSFSNPSSRWRHCRWEGYVRSGVELWEQRHGRVRGPRVSSMVSGIEHPAQHREIEGAAAAIPALGDPRAACFQVSRRHWQDNDNDDSR